MTQTLTITDPRDGSAVGELACATDQEVSAAVAAAHKAAPEWARTDPGERGALVAAAAASLRDHVDRLTELTTREMGKPEDDARGGVEAGIGTLEQYAQLGPVHRGRALQGSWQATDLMVPQPRGVVAAITPWNDPVAVPCGLLGAALVTGNTVLLKPSERTPHTGLELARLLQQALPEGVLQVLVGDAATGALLAGADVDVVAHVGSTRAGRAIAEATARTGAKALLENGGNDPLVVDSDVDVAWAADQAATGCFANAGQICTSVERVYVVEDVAEAFLETLVEQADGREIGPLVDERMRREVHEHVEDAVGLGATLLAGGVVPDGPGSHYPCTVLTGCDSRMRIMREETFGPTAPVQVVGSFGEALEHACAGDHGLAATVLTASMGHAQQAWRELPVGTVKVNAVFGGAPGGAAQPRGRSGQGFGYGPELLDEMTTTKVVHLGLPGS
ncbi:MAG TPA: aldehyde dehydrogenase family protein [Marmoricola sp.]|nr:aldehyde dehydrogenase family protein [Marmoricola sp.]